MTTPPVPLSHANIYDFFCGTAAACPERPFVNVLAETAGVYAIPAGEITYRAMLDRIAHRKRELSAAGFGPGHRIGLLVENRPVFFEYWLAMNALGISLVPINPDLRSDDLRYLIGHSGISLAVAPASRHAELQSAVEGGFAVIEIGAPIPAALRYAESAAVDQNTEAALLYTSGTTGRPKGCVLTNRYFLNCGDWYRNVGGYCGLTFDGERMITPLPLYHMNALACSTMGMIATGGCLSIVDRFHPTSWWDSVREADATCFHYLGVMPAILMASPQTADERDHAVRFGFGAGVDKRIHAAFEARFGIPLIEAWAMTETGNGVVIAAAHGDRHVGTSCFGSPSPDIEVRLERDDRTAADDGEPGELLVRRAGNDPRFGFFDRYLNDPAATDEAWSGGWFHTGDVVKRNSDGSLVFVDRKKNVIRRSGENIAAVEVEDTLSGHPDIKAVAVAASPDPVRGDEVFACVVLEDHAHGADRRELARQIVCWSLERLAYYKAPGYVSYVDRLPLTTTNKIQRGALKALVAERLNSPDTIDTRGLKKRTAS